jgi:hypothetical protein
LRDIHQRRFAGSDAERFTRLWCEVAAICNVSPLEMHEDKRVVDLCPPWRLLGLTEPSPRLENLEALIMEESKDRPPPESTMWTVGEVLDYLLESSTGPAGVGRARAHPEKR